MKTFKQLLEFLDYQNPNVAPISGSPLSVDQDDIMIGELDDPKVFDQLNAYCKQISLKQYINPYYPLNTLWMKLSLVGINFDLNEVKFIGDAGIVEIKLNAFGGRYGFLDQSGLVKKDDGLTNVLPGGLFLIIYYQKSGGIYSMDCQLKRGDR